MRVVRPHKKCGKPSMQCWGCEYGRSHVVKRNTLRDHRLGRSLLKKERRPSCRFASSRRPGWKDKGAPLGTLDYETWAKSKGYRSFRPIIWSDTSYKVVKKRHASFTPKYHGSAISCQNSAIIRHWRRMEKEKNKEKLRAWMRERIAITRYPTIILLCKRETHAPMTLIREIYNEEKQKLQAS